MATSNDTSVYLYYDANGVLIYVGITSRGVRRQREHEREKPWWKFTARQEIEHFPTRREALEREGFLIRAFSPPFNTQHNPDKNTRDVYLQLADASLSRQKKAERMRIPLRVVAVTDSEILAVTTMEYVHEASQIEPAGTYQVAVPGAKVKGHEIKRVGGSLAIRVQTTRMSSCGPEGSLMFRQYPKRRDIKRIDFFEAGAA